MVEPLIAQEMTYVSKLVHEKDAAGFYFTTNETATGYAPLISGFGRTHSHKFGPHVGFVRGLSKEYMKKPWLGAIIIKDNMYASIYGIYSGISGTAGMQSFDNETLVLTDNGKLTIADTADQKVQNAFTDLRYTKLFDNMRKLDATLKIPQYFEFAALGGDDAADYYVTQIADEPSKTFAFDEKNCGEVFAVSAKSVLVGGSLKAPCIIEIYGKDGWDHLRQINDALGTKYILAYSTGPQNRPQGLGYSSFSNAGAVIQQEDSNDLYHDLSRIFLHFGGILAMTGKIFAEFGKIDFEKIKSRANVDNSRSGITIYHILAELVASEAQQKAILRVRDE